MHRGKEEWSVGDRVQWIDYQNERKLFAGVITGLTTTTKEKRRYGYAITTEVEHVISHVTVKWDDGEEETLDEYDVQPEDNPLEREFRNTAPAILAQINEKLDVAEKALAEAERLAEEHGVPFSSGISPLGQSYFPRSISTKWDDVCHEVLEEVTEAYGSEQGWQHSAVCY